ncbi:ABC transporter substrate-binding protein [Marinobacter salinus]|uniref:ABC transporter substrate-binding protein n=1 Tax=Marinobacter salinus TaxID=1874317 RepID=UPI0012FD584B|nr:ABC transporter substrate binding protein [Marinobacter salinus]
MLLVIPEESAVYSNFVGGFSACIGTKGDQGAFYKVKTISQIQAEPEPFGTQRIVAVGAEAAEFMHNHPHGRQFTSALTPEISIRRLLESASQSPGVRSAFLLDQPLNRRLSLIRTLLPEADSLSVVLGPGSAYLKEELVHEAKRLGFAMQVVTVKSGEEVPQVSADLFDNSDGLFLIYDPVLTPSSVIRFLFYSAYQKRVPVFGYSEGYVKAGAVAAIYSTAEELGCQVGEHLTQDSRNQAGDPGQEKAQVYYPEYYSYRVNPSVANSLGIRIDNLPANQPARLEKQ